MTTTKKHHRRPTQPYTQTPNWMSYLGSSLTDRDFRILTIIHQLTHGYHRRKYSFGYENISLMTGIPVKKVGQSVKRLAEQGYLRRTKNGNNWILELNKYLFQDTASEFTECEIKCGDVHLKQGIKPEPVSPKQGIETEPNRLRNGTQQVTNRTSVTDELNISIKENNINTKAPTAEEPLPTAEGVGLGSQLDLFETRLKRVCDKWPKTRSEDFTVIYNQVKTLPPEDIELGLQVAENYLLPKWKQDGGEMAYKITNYWQGEYFKTKPECMKAREEIERERAIIEQQEKQHQEWQQAKGCPQFERFQMLLEGNEENYQEGIISEDKYLQIKAGYERRLNQFAQA